MKRILGLMMVFGLALTSCNNDENDIEVPEDNPVTTSGIMTCKINGSTWQSTTAASVIGNGLINVTGQITSTGEMITMTLNAETATVNSLAQGTGSFAAYKETSSSATSFVSHTAGGSGTTSVTQINTSNHTVSGTFMFTGVRTTDYTLVQITEGVFTNIPYTEEAAATFNNTFDADIDGVAFNPTLIYAASAFNMISITGYENGSFPSIGISLPDDVTPGTYTTSAWGSNKILYNASQNTGSNADGSYSGTPGTIIVTSHNTSAKTIEGTFSCTAVPVTGSNATNNYAITNGVFSVEY